MTREAPRVISHIMVATNLTTESVGGVVAGVQLAAALDADLHLVNVAELDPGSATSPAEQERLRLIAQEELGLFARSHDVPPGAQLHARVGRAAGEILTAGQEIGADLIVMGYRRGQYPGAAMGPNLARVLRKSPASVLVVPSEFRGSFRHVAVGTDFSAGAALALRRGAELAARLQLGGVTLLHVFEFPVGHHGVESAEAAVEHTSEVCRARAEQMVAEVLGPEARPVRFVCAEGAPGSETGALAAREGVDLLVIGAQGRTAAAMVLLGRTSEQIILNARCAVWAEKSPQLFENFVAAMKAWLGLEEGQI